MTGFGIEIAPPPLRISDTVDCKRLVATLNLGPHIKYLRENGKMPAKIRKTTLTAYMPIKSYYWSVLKRLVD